MDIHRPKAMHSWAEFAKEVGIIVLGVLIALGAEQLAQALEWRQKAGEAEGFMRTEIGRDDGPQVYARIAVAGCLDQQLAEIRGAVEGGEPRARLIQRLRDYRPPEFTWDSYGYRAAETSGALFHMRKSRMDDFTQIYAGMPDADRISATESADAAQLRAIPAVGGTMSEAERLRILSAVEALLADNLAIKGDAVIMADGMGRAGAMLDGEGQARLQGETTHNQSRPELAGCLAKGAVDLKRITSQAAPLRFSGQVMK